MPELSAQLPQIIAEAAKSPLGIFALMIISLAILGFFFFKEASEKTRIAIFVMMFVGVAVFGLSIFRTTAGTAPVSGTGTDPVTGTAGAAADPSVKSILGSWTAEVTYDPPKSFTESFAFELLGGELLVKATFLSAPRSALNSSIGNSVVRFEIPWQETNGDVTRDIRNIYVGQIDADRIDFVMRDDRGGPPVRFQAARSR